MLGFLNLNKPTGLTSHDCVARVRRLLKTKRVGHGGTLDPSATGVLPIAVGKATRLLPYLPENKAYHARIRFGVCTATDDLEGEILATQSASDLTLEAIQPLLSQFLGKIEQIPPAYSAIQRDGKRLYELARKGEKVEVPVRTVAVDRIDILAWYPGEFPELEVTIACGPGTYIRAIARDLGKRLNVGGTLAALTRTESCGMKLAQSLTFEQLDTQLAQGTFSLITEAIALEHLPVIYLEPLEAKRWCQGQTIVKNDAGTRREGQHRQGDKEEFTHYRIHNLEAGQFLGIGKWVDSTAQGLIVPKIVLN